MSGRSCARGTPVSSSIRRTHRTGVLSHWDMACEVMPRSLARATDPPARDLARLSAACCDIKSMGVR